MITALELANTIKAFAKTKDVAVGRMLSDCDLSVNTLSSMKSGGYFPRLEAITKIADYLDCSVDYLLGRTDNPDSHHASVPDPEGQFSPKKALLETFEQLSEGDQYILIGEARNLLNTWKERSVAAGGLVTGKEDPSSGTEGNVETQTA